MKFLFKSKDGGQDSLVTGYWLFESKRFGSIVLLRFDKGSREVYHNHAFNAISWVLSGELQECVLGSLAFEYLVPSLKPVFTPRSRFHKVYGMAPKTWVLSFRGPWKRTWNEFSNSNSFSTLTHGRKIVNV